MKMDLDIYNKVFHYFFSILCLLLFLTIYPYSFRLRGVDALLQTEILKMRHDLSLISEADFRIVLAQAEKTRSGIISFLFGDESQYSVMNQAIKTSYV